MTSEERGASDSGIVRRLAWGTLPIVIVCLLLWGVGMDPTVRPPEAIAAFVACVVVLWFGWNLIQRSVATKWLGVLLALYLGLVLGLFLLGISVGLLFVLFPLFILALPFLVWDLLFRAPFKGRFARARAEWRHLRS
jgi:hypothetical protein